MQAGLPVPESDALAATNALADGLSMADNIGVVAGITLGLELLKLAALNVVAHLGKL